MSEKSRSSEKVLEIVAWLMDKAMLGVRWWWCADIRSGTLKADVDAVDMDLTGEKEEQETACGGTVFKRFI